MFELSHVARVSLSPFSSSGYFWKNALLKHETTTYLQRSTVSLSVTRQLGLPEQPGSLRQLSYIAVKCPPCFVGRQQLANISPSVLVRAHEARSVAASAEDFPKPMHWPRRYVGTTPFPSFPVELFRIFAELPFEDQQGDLFHS